MLTQPLKRPFAPVDPDVVAARERLVFLVRCGLLAALITSLWAFHHTYLSDAAGADGEDGPKPVVLAEGIVGRFAPKVARGAEVRAVVRRFLQARQRGDARTACRMLTPNQRVVTAWRVSGRRQPVSDASCRRQVLRSSEDSDPTHPLLIAMLEEGFWVERYGMAALARPYAMPRWALSMIELDGSFRIDTEALRRSNWVRQDCLWTFGYRPNRCNCIYDEARVIGLRRWGTRHDVKLPSRTVFRAARACA
ncbi:MAG: hypothetical protein M3340_20470 [Actinomycetota bacterium]|nr:hypothetical protein [Actinomycetota bacterium]